MTDALKVDCEEAAPLKLRTTNQKICLWLGYSFFLVYLLGFVVVANFIPPHTPTLGTAEIAEMFQDNKWRILVGQSICVIASALYVPWSVAIFSQLLRIETKRVARVPALSYLALTSGAIGMVFFMLPSMIWIAMAFHTPSAGDYLRLMDDFAWMIWFISTPLFIVQEIAVGLCVLIYRNDVFKRWFGWYSMLTVTSLVPVCWVALFKTGPFAWDGAIGFYLPITIFMVWFHLMTWSVYRAIKQEDAENRVSDGELLLGRT